MAEDKKAKKEEKLVGKVVKFEAEIDGKKVPFEIGDPDIPKFHVPGFGVMTSEEAVKNEAVLAFLIENDCTIVKKGGK